MNPSVKQVPGRVLGVVCVLFVFFAMPVMAIAAPYAAVVMDARSGEILFARNHDTRLHPASLTKMMTLYIAFEAVKNGEITLDTQVTISRNAASEVCSCLGLRAGQKIALRYLIRASAVRSGNDAATAIGEVIAGSEAAFAARMTRTARAMGMENTTFKNAHGLTHPEHLSTARDMTILGRQLFFDYPQYYNLFSRRSTHAGIAEVLNTNRRFLDSYRGADGIKTGYTRAAGFNLVGSAERGGKRIIATVFGGQSVAHRNAKMTELLDLGFSRAPAQVALRRPPTPDYAATGGTSGGRIIRVNVTVSRSPLPRLRSRPAPEPDEETLIALRDSIGAALDAAQADTALAAAAPAEPPMVVPEARPEEIAAATPEPAPETGAEAESEALPQPQTEDIIVALAEEAQAPGPAPRPDDDATAQQTAAAPAEQGAADPREKTDHGPDSAPAAAAQPAQTPPSQTPAPQILLTSSTPPPRPAEALVVALGQADSETTRARSEPVEVVMRQLSSSDARVWGINIGRFGSQFEAERALMQTALAEMSALEGSLRKVQRGSGGFDATFLGLTRDQADRACRRLQARDRLCFTMGP